MILMSENRAQDLHFDIKATGKNPEKTVVKTPTTEFIIKDHKHTDKFNKTVSPEEYFLSALASCISRISHVVAYEKDIDVGNIDIEVQGDINPAKFKGEDTETRPGFKDITVSVDAETEAGEDKVKDWMDEVENRSQIKDSVEKKVPVSVEID